MIDSRILLTGLLVAALLLVGPPALLAQDAAAPAQKTAAGDSVKKSAGPATARVEVVFRDGSTVRMEAAAIGMVVATKYGQLTVPLHEVRRIRLRPRLSDEMIKQIAETIAAMGSTTFAKREAAMPKLKAMGVRSLPYLRKAMQDANAEIRSRASKLVEEMEKQIPEQELEVTEHDVIETIEFTVTGTVLTQSFSAHSKFLGDVQVNLKQLRSLRSLDAPARLQFNMDAAQFASANRWMETTIEIERRDQIRVTASGQIDLYPDDGEAGTYLSSPKGANMEEFIGRRGRGKGDFKPGTLVGRFGSQGKPFVIGERYSAISYETGRLYLRIIPSPFDETCSGHYKVTINVTKPSGDGSPEAKPGKAAKNTPKK